MSEATASGIMHIPAGALQPAAALPQSLLDLPFGEARESLLAVHRVLGETLPAGDLSIYEAGGGSTCFLSLDLLRRARVTVVDIDAEQLRNNDYAQEKIQGDIQTYRFPRETFDLITCYNVLEHVPDAEAALNGFCETLKQGGLLLIGAPNPRSLSGIVTKYTPHWFHVWYYRQVKGDKLAGLPGQPPFRIFYHPLVALPNLEAFAGTRGLEVIYLKPYESPRFPEMRARMPLLAATLDTLAAALNVFLPKQVDVRHGDYHVILRKR
jgi:SAM-dependent methyltransferase